MLIHVGSENPVKIQAVQLALQNYERFKWAEIKGVKVHSGVSPQPKNILETLAGAEKRAKEAFHDCDYSVGLESGTIILPSHPEPRYLEQTICAFYDGKETGLGFSPAFEIPFVIAGMLREENLDLEQACLRAGLTHNPRVGQAEGIIGILTHDIVDRTAYTIPAIQMALTRLQNPELYTRRY